MGAGGHVLPPPKIREKVFFGQLRKIRGFSGKNHAKIREFC